MKVQDGIRVYVRIAFVRVWQSVTVNVRAVAKEVTVHVKIVGIKRTRVHVVANVVAVVVAQKFILDVILVRGPRTPSSAASGVAGPEPY